MLFISLEIVRFSDQFGEFMLLSGMLMRVTSAPLNMMKSSVDILFMIT